MLPAAWEYDDKIMQLTPQAELLFLRMVSMSNSVQSYGVLSGAQVQSCARGMRSLGRSCVELVQAGLLDHDVSTTQYRIKDRVKWYLDPPNDNVSPHKPEARTAGRKHDPQSVSTPGVSRAPAHVKKEREIEREEGRTPSGSVRPSSAQAAPRGPNGAAHPAPTPPPPEIPDEGTMTGAEARAAIRATLDRAKQKVPGSTGRDTKFSKYDPDRPITPITSAMAMGYGDE